MNLPKMPSKGTALLPGLSKTVEDIVKFLPTLVVYGDNRTTFVNESAYGRIIRAKGVNKGASFTASDTMYKGPFAMKFDEESDEEGNKVKKIKIKGGYFSRNGKCIYLNTCSLPVPKQSCYLCIEQSYTSSGFNTPKISSVIEPSYPPARTAYSIIGEYHSGDKKLLPYNIPFPILIIYGICDDE